VAAGAVEADGDRGGTETCDRTRSKQGRVPDGASLNGADAKLRGPVESGAQSS